MQPCNLSCQAVLESPRRFYRPQDEPESKNRFPFFCAMKYTGFPQERQKNTRTTRKIVRTMH